MGYFEVWLIDDPHHIQLSGYGHKIPGVTH